MKQVSFPLKCSNNSSSSKNSDKKFLLFHRYFVRIFIIFPVVGIIFIFGCKKMGRFLVGMSGLRGGFLVLILATIATCQVGRVQTKLDSINVDKYLQNTELVEEHMRCLIYSGLFYTYRYTGITSTRCGVCTPEQEAKLNKIAQHWQQHYPLAWRELTNFLATG